MSKPQSCFLNPYQLRERRNSGAEPCPCKLPEQGGLLPFGRCPNPHCGHGCPVSLPPFLLPNAAIYLSEGGGEWMVRGASGCLGAGVRLRVGPELLVLLPAKALVVVAFALK